MIQRGHERVLGMLSPTFRRRFFHVFSEVWVSVHCPGHGKALKTHCLINIQQKRRGKGENWRMRKGAFRLKIMLICTIIKQLTRTTLAVQPTTL